MISLTNHDSSEGEQWGRYNLPRLMYPLWINHPDIYFPLADETESLLLNHHLRVLGEWEDGQLGEDFDKVISPPIENATIGYIFNIIIYIYIHIYIWWGKGEEIRNIFNMYVYIYIYIIPKHSAKAKKYISPIKMVLDWLMIFLRDPIEGNIVINISI